MFTVIQIQVGSAPRFLLLTSMDYSFMCALVYLLVSGVNDIYLAGHITEIDLCVLTQVHKFESRDWKTLSVKGQQQIYQALFYGVMGK